MSFIRAKQIPPGKGNWYDYEVKTVHEGKRVIQKFVRYIGKSADNQSNSVGHTTHKAYVPRPLPVIAVDSTNKTSSIVTCKYCQSERIRKFGTYKGIQRYWCKDCERKFVNNGAIPKMKVSSKQIASAMGMYYGGMSLDAIQQQFKQDYDTEMSESNYWNWVKRFTKEAMKQCQDFKPDVGDEWVADETYMKLGKKIVYFWDIIDIKTRYLIASHVSFSRGAKEAQQLMKLAEKRAGKTPKIVRTDKLRSYVSGIEDAFGADTKHIQGGPFKFVNSGESTAEIERFHKTLEQRTKVFEKFKDMASIRLLTDGWLINYNFFKQNEGCGNIPPAQAMSKTVPFKDWNDVVRDKEVIPKTEYKVTRHERPNQIDIHLKPITE